MVTAETISNAQIDKVYISASGPACWRIADADLMHACTVARNTHGDFTSAEQAAASVTVAAAYNELYKDARSLNCQEVAHHCEQCGWAGTGFHACLGLPGKSQL